VKEASAPTETAPRQEPAGRALFAAGFSALVYAAGLILPPLYLLSPAAFPLAVQRIRGSVGSAVMAALAAAALIAILFAPGYAIVFVATGALPGLVLGEAMARGRGLRRATAWTLLVALLQSGVLLVFASGWIAKQMIGVGMWSAERLQELRALGTPPELVAERAASAELWRGVVEVVHPALFIVLGATLVLVNAWLLGIYLSRRDPGWLEGGEFEGMRWPLGLAAAFVVCGAAVLSPPLRPFAYNGLVVLAFCFALQGLAVVAYYFRRLAAPPLMIAILMAVLLAPYAPHVLALLGLFDIFIDFRKWAEPPVEEG
jgi:Predicted membrane protein (DUF2232)